MAFQFPNPTPVFPVIPGLTYSVFKRPTFATVEFMSVSGRRVTSPQQAYPLWEFEVKFDFLKDQTQNAVPYQQNAGRHDFTNLSALFLACAGKYGQFFFNDPTDNSRTGQQIAIADGVSTAYTAMRTWGYGPISITEPVGGIQELDNVYINGVIQPANLYSFEGNVITFTEIPAATAIITIDFSFWYLLQFLEDQHDYEQFMTNLWTFGSCKMRSVKQ